MKSTSAMPSRRLWAVLCLVAALELFIWHRHTAKVPVSRRSRIQVLVSSPNLGSDDMGISVATAMCQITLVKTTITLSIMQRGAMETDLVSHVKRGMKWSVSPNFVPPAEMNSRQYFSNHGFDVVIATQCAEELTKRSNQYQHIFSATSARLYCAVQSVDLFHQRGPLFAQLQPWISSRRLRIITPSDRVAQSLLNSWRDAALLVPITVLPPVFRLPNEVLGRNDGELVKNVPEKISLIAHDHKLDQNDLQSFNAAEHSHTLKTYALALEETNKRRWRPAKGFLIGRMSNVVSNDTLPSIFQSFQQPHMPMNLYHDIARSSALILSLPQRDINTTFTGDISSAISASIITGTPVVMDEDLLEEYPHLSKDATILVRGTESHFQAAFRQIAYPSLSQTRKRHNVETLRTTLIVQNKHKLQMALFQDVYGRKYMY